MPEPQKGVAYTYYAPLIDSGNRPKFRANPTIAAGDFKISKDDGALANLTTTPVVSPAGSIWVKIALSADEMNADKVKIQAIDAAGGEWDDAAWYFDLTKFSTDDIAGGDGAITVTLTCKDNNGNTIDGAENWLTVDSAGTDRKHGVRYSDALGKVTFYVDPGTYYWWSQKAGIDFTNPQKIVVNAE